MYRLIPLRQLRRTAGVLFDEMVPSDIPSIQGIDRVIHKANGISPGPCEGVKRPWYTCIPVKMITYSSYKVNDSLTFTVPRNNKLSSFIITPDKVYKNNKLYCNQPAMIVWPAGIFHRIISGSEGSISINLSTRTSKFDLANNFNIYDLDTTTGAYKVIRDGASLDKPDFSYKFKSLNLKKLLEE